MRRRTRFVVVSVVAVVCGAVVAATLVFQSIKRSKESTLKNWVRIGGPGSKWRRGNEVRNTDPTDPSVQCDELGEKGDPTVGDAKSDSSE